jgi:hypothetical protein
MDMRENSTTQILIKKLGLDEVEKTWKQLGMYKGSIELSARTKMYVSPYVLRYMSHKYNWKRNVNKLSAIYKGVKAGTVPAAYYKHLIFPEVQQNERENNH